MKERYIYLGILVSVGVLVNFALLFWMIFGLRTELSTVKEQVTANTDKKENAPQEITPMPTPPIVSENTGAACSADCKTELDEIKKMLVSLTPPGTSFTSVPLSAGTQIKEVFVPLGTGKTKSSEWEDIPGMTATVNTLNYSKIKSAAFEVAIRIPTANGTVYARLFNKTDKHPVWNSEVSSEGPVSTLKSAQNLSLDSGEKQYQVQMKTTLQVDSLADSARIKIVLE